VSSDGTVWTAGDGYVARLDSTGEGWDAILRLPKASIRALTLDTAGTPFIAAVAGSKAFIARVQTDASGLAWRTELAASQMPNALAIAPDRTLLISGNGPAHGFLTVVDNAGRIVESNEIGDSPRDRLNAVATDPQGHTWVAGSTGTGVPDVLLVRADSISASIANHLKAGRLSGSATGAPFAAGSTNPLSAAGITLGTNSLAVGRGAGTGTLVIGTSGTWTAKTTAAWLHISVSSGTGSALFEFTYDANSGPIRTGTISFNDGAEMLTVTQAGDGYVAATKVTTIASSALSAPAADAGGNLYFTESDTILKWTVATGQVTTLVPLGLTLPPRGVAVDRLGDVYFADTSNGAIKKWTAGTRQVTTLASGHSPNALTYVALDAAGNVYFPDSLNNTVQKWTAVTGTVTTLVSSGLSNPQGVAVDTAGNVYIANLGNSLIKKWIAATGQTITLVSSGLTLYDQGNLAVDREGNLYTIDYYSGLNAVKEWVAATNQVTTLMEGTSEFFPYRVTVDAAGKLYVVYNKNQEYWPTISAILGTTVSSPSAAVGVGVDGLGNVFFTNTNPQAPQAPISTIYKWTAGTGQFTNLFPNNNFDFNAASAVAAGRTGNVYIGFSSSGVLKWTQATGAFTEIAPLGGTSSFPPQPTGVAVDDSGNVYFGTACCSAAIEKWTAATGETSTLTSGQFTPEGLALDTAGDVYFADTFGERAIKKWIARTGQLTTLLSAPVVNYPSAVAVDGTGDVYFDNNDLIEKWNAASGTVSIVAAPILTPFFEYSPNGVSGARSLAVDAIGDLYVANSTAIEKITRAFVNPQAIVEPLMAGSGQLPQVLPASTPLDALSDQPWLTITSQDDGVVKFSFTTTTTPRTGHISLLGQTIPVTQANAKVPTVVSWSVLWGLESYSLTGSTRNRLPWQIIGLRVAFSEPIASGDTGSLSGVTATALNGLGTNTLTWTIDPVSLGSFPLALAQSGPHAVKDSAGNALTGSPTQILKVLWGDYNDDGVVNATDLAGVSLLTKLAYTLFADMNGDGTVDAADVQIVRTQIGNALP
jgi:streptogramin lyase